MTVIPQIRFVEYAGNGTSGPFAYPFRILSEDDLVVRKSDADGVGEIITGFNVVGVGQAGGGTVTITEPVLIGEVLLIYSKTSISQSADYVTGDSFPAESHEQALDRLTLIAQDLRRDVDRSLKAPLGEVIDPLGFAEARARSILAFDEAGRPDHTKSYVQFIQDVAESLEITEAIIATVEAEGDQQFERLGSATNAALAQIDDQVAEQIGLFEAAADAATAEMGALGTINGIFDTMTAGLAAVAEGELFGVPLSMGYGLQVYKDLGGIAVHQFVLPHANGLRISLERIAERSPLIAEQYPFKPDIDVAFIDGKIYNGERTSDRARPDKQPSPTMLFDTTGWIKNATGLVANPSLTPYSVTGPGSLSNSAQRTNFSAGNQILYLHRYVGGTTPALPGGDYTLEFWARTRPGQGDKVLKAGRSGSLTDCTIKELDWAVGANESQVKFQVEFTLTEENAEDVVIRTGTGVTADIDLDRVRLCRGPKERMPAWSEDYMIGARPWGGQIMTFDGDLMDGSASTFRGMMVPDPGYKLGGTTYDHALVIAAFSADGVGAQNGLVVSIDDDDYLGTVATTAFTIGFEAAAGYEGRLLFEPLTAQTRAYLPTDVRGAGVLVIGALISNNGVSTTKKFFCGPQLIKSYNETAANLGPVRQWRLLSNNNDIKPEKTNFKAPAKLAHFQVKKLPSDWSLNEVQRMLRAVEMRMRLRDLGSVGVAAWNLLDGDSNDDLSDPTSWGNLVARKGWLGLGGTADNLFTTNIAVGGAGMLNGTSQYPQHMADEGWSIVEAAVGSDLPIIVSLRGWTNDYQNVATDPAGTFAAYRSLFYDVALNMGPKVCLHLSSPIAKDVAGGFTAFNTNRYSIENWLHELRDEYSAIDGWQRIQITDLTSSATLGNYLDATSTHAYSDGLHLSGCVDGVTGDAEMAALMKPGYRALMSRIMARFGS